MVGGQWCATETTGANSTSSVPEMTKWGYCSSSCVSNTTMANAGAWQAQRGHWSLTAKLAVDQTMLCDTFGLTVKPYWMIGTMALGEVIWAFMLSDTGATIKLKCMNIVMLLWTFLKLLFTFVEIIEIAYKVDNLGGSYKGLYINFPPPGYHSKITQWDRYELVCYLWAQSSVGGNIAGLLLAVLIPTVGEDALKKMARARLKAKEVAPEDYDGGGDQPHQPAEGRPPSATWNVGDRVEIKEEYLDNLVKFHRTDAIGTMVDNLSLRSRARPKDDHGDYITSAHGFMILSISPAEGGKPATADLVRCSSDGAVDFMDRCCSTGTKVVPEGAAPEGGQEGAKVEGIPTDALGATRHVPLMGVCTPAN